MTSPALPAPSTGSATSRLLTGGGLDELWPERRPLPRPWLLVAVLLVGIAGAAVIPDADPGAGYFAVVFAAGAVVASSDDRLRTRHHLVGAVLCALLLSPLVLLDAEWMVALCVLTAVAVGVSTLVDARSLTGIVASGLAVPLAALRGMPWLVRSATFTRRIEGVAPAVRTVGISFVLVSVFGLLFASADALFSTWAGAVVPDLSGLSLTVRIFVLVFVSGVTLAASYVALNPPRVEELALRPGRAVRRAFEWLVPVGLVVAVFVTFLVAQATAMFGGHAYLRRTTGLTYADYVHQGFGQMTVATLLTLGVVAMAARKAARVTPRDRLLVRAVLGLLCALTLAVAASALYRMHLYEEAYGFTRMRLLVSAFEAWLGLVVVLVLAAGVRLSGGWVPRTAMLTGAVTVLALATLNPDAYIARQNIDRYQETGKVDLTYLRSLSTDAVPALADGQVGIDPCRADLDGRRSASGLSWNLSRARYRALDCP